MAYRFPVVAAKGFPGSAVYNACKGAMGSAMRVLSSELAPKKVQVNAINPSLVITERTQAAGMLNNNLRGSRCS
ncbi:MAG: SDR family oxidoreductase [Planctomycetaceae bacterium]